MASSIGQWFQKIGGIADLFVRGLFALFQRPRRFGAIAAQVESIGVRSVLIALLTALFSAAVMTVQLAVQLARFGARDYIGNAVSLTIVRELGPVLTALMVGGRVSAGIVAELGSMTVTDQIDAMRAMGADPIKELVMPRVVATMIVLPLMTAMSLVVSIGGAMALCAVEYGIAPAFFYHSLLQTVRLPDLIGGISKTFFFAASIAASSCYLGLSTVGGTWGVGGQTRDAVVFTSVATLVLDFGLTRLLLEAGY